MQKDQESWEDADNIPQPDNPLTTKNKIALTTTIY